ncbi:VIT1/CCC1 transporter family protein [Neorhodopirellula pilleata]|nr:VIT1/CCC1 transporter family protein [Neorhodopirellula pilleata]
MAPSRQSLAKTHSRDQIRERLDQGHRIDYLPDFIYGAIDGTVTTFAVVSGVAGADLSSGIVIVLGLANLVGDGFSMAASNYSGTRVEQQLRQRMRSREAYEIETYPEGEREEVRQIFAGKGFQGEELETVVRVITSDKERWIDTMMTEEMGIGHSQRSPIKAAIATLAAFVVVGFIPLISFVWQAISANGLGDAYLSSVILTAIAFFCVGAVKSRFVDQHWFVSGIETLALGGSAASLAYLVGWSLSGLTAG